ncbi:hypothetical protein BGZ80_003199, partial [Entomortierella chlamydospora]
ECHKGTAQLWKLLQILWVRNTYHKRMTDGKVLQANHAQKTILIEALVETLTNATVCAVSFGDNVNFTKCVVGALDDDFVVLFKSYTMA